jgi:hypothetical protein
VALPRFLGWGTVARMVRVFGGAVLVIAGIAAFIEAHSRRPIPGSRHFGPCVVVRGHQVCAIHVSPSRGLSHTAYDLLRIGGWASVVVGSLLIVLGLIGAFGRPAETAAP